MNLGDLVITVGAKIDGFKQAMGDVSSSLDGTANKATSTASMINKAFAAAFGAGVAGLAFGAAAKFDEAFVQIQHSTGATGEKLEGLKESFVNVYKQADESAKEVTDALTVLSSRTGTTGKDLEKLTLSLLELGKTQHESVIALAPVVTRVFGDWSIAAKDQAGAMNYLAAVSQQTGTSVARLSEQVVYAGAPLRQLGYNFEQSAALIGKFEKEGVNTELVLGGMKAALQKFAREGVTDTAQAWQDFVKGVKNGGITLQEVMQEVGAKRGVDLFKAITEGRFEVDEFTKSTKKLSDEGGANVQTFAEKWKIMGHEVEAVIAGHYQIITALGLTWPAIAALGGGFKTMSVGAISAISNIVSAFQLGLVPALSTVELAVLGIGTALAPILGGALVGALQKIQNSIDPNSPAWSILLGLRTAGAAAGFDTGLEPQAKPRVNQADYVKNLTPPKEAPKPTGGGGGGKPALDDKEIKQAFSQLGIQDLQGQLENALEAFNTLKNAGKLSESWQIEQATEHINDLRGQIAELAAGWKQLPKPTNDLLDTLGVKHDSASRVQEMGAALAELSSRIQAFVGPQQAGGLGNKLTEAWQNYAHAVATADDEFKKHIDDVPWLKYASAIDTVDTSFTNAFSSTSLYVKTVADLNQELKAHNDVLRELPEQERALTQSILDPWAAIKGVTDAFHYFNIKTPEELAAHAKESKRQYEIIKNAAGDAAVSTQIAWHKAMLDQIEMDHELGITDQELYEQRKRMAEDALKHLEGQYKGNSTAIKKDRYDLGKELESMSHRTFDSLERDLAKDIVQWKGWKDTIKDIGQTLATDFVQIMLKGVFKPLEDAFAGLAKKAGDALSGIFGGTSQAVQQGTQTATTAASGAASGAGSAASSASSGIGGIVNMVTGAVSAVSAVIGNFQMMGMNKSLDVQVNHTLRIFNVVAQMLQEMYDGKNQLFAKLDDIWNEVRNVVTAIRGGVAGQGGAALDQLRDYAALQVRKIDEFIVPRMDTMIGLMKGGQMAAATPGNITIYVQGGDPAETARQVVSHLKRNGVYL